jgi:hypothetical protein
VSDGEGGEDTVGGAGIGIDVGGGVTAEMFEHFVGGEEFSEAFFEMVVVIDREGAAAGYEFARFAEAVVVGAEEERGTVDGGFEGVVDTFAETAADVGDTSVTVEGGELSVGIDKEAVGGRDVGRWSGREADDGAVDTFLDVEEFLFVDFVGGEDEVEFGMGVDVGDEDIIVHRPCAAGDHQASAGFGGEALEGGGGRDVMRLGAYLDDAVETGVAGDGHIGDADLAKEAAGVFVLNEDVGESLEQAGVRPSVMAEEELVIAEDGADEISGDTAALEGGETVTPYLILDEDGGDDVDAVKEIFDASRGIEREVGDDVGAGVQGVLFVSRRGEESQEDAVSRMLVVDSFEEWPALLELTGGGGMAPDVAGGGVGFGVQGGEDIVLPVEEAACLAVPEEGGEAYQESVEVDNEAVHDAIRLMVSVLPRMLMISKRWGPLPCPTRARRRVVRRLPAW